jgi:hypothetical protein
LPIAISLAVDRGKSRAVAKIERCSQRIERGDMAIREPTIFHNVAALRQPAAVVHGLLKIKVSREGVRAQLCACVVDREEGDS